MSTLDALAQADRERVGRLLDDAISRLWYSSPDCLPEDDDCQGCCPVCCSPCTVIAELYHAGQLDAWVRESPHDPTRSSTWDETRDQVDREWLLRSWRHANTLNCHDGIPGQDEAVIDLLDQLRHEIAAH